jgi:hypothetical protein
MAALATEVVLEGLLARADAPVVRTLASLSAEEFIELPDWCGLPITDAQRAFVRLADGLPVQHLSPSDLEYHCGARELQSPTIQPKMVYIRSGRRSGKTLLSGLLLVLRALTLPLRRSPIGNEKPERDGMVGPSPGEPVQIPIVAPRLEDQALKTLNQLLARLQQSPQLKRYVVSQIGHSFILRRDDGEEVLVKALAAAPRGTNIRGGWAIGGLFNEADFFGEKDASITLADQVEALAPAVVNGGQMYIESSPWDDNGDFFNGHANAFGNPGISVSFHSDTMRMNPTAITQAELDEKRKADPEFVAREYDAVPLSSASKAYFPKEAIAAACILPDVLMPPDGSPHWAGADLGVAKNSAALALARCGDGTQWGRPGLKTILAYVNELIPTKDSPLSPKGSCRAFAKACVLYNASSVRSDGFNKEVFIDEINEIREELGRPIYYDPFVANAVNQAAAFSEFRRRMVQGELLLPNNPRLIKQLTDCRVKKMVGGVGVELAVHGWAHSDYLMAVVLACIQVPPRAPGHVERFMGQTPILPFG